MKGNSLVANLTSVNSYRYAVMYYIASRRQRSGGVHGVAVLPTTTLCSPGPAGERENNHTPTQKIHA